MSHNSYIRPAGIWGSNLPVLHGEFAGFDLSQFKSVNGDDGGTWANVNTITFGGGFTVGGITTLNGTSNVAAMNFFGLASFAANIAVNSYATFNGPVAITAAVTATQGITPRHLAGPDADTTIDPLLYDTVCIQTTTSNRTYSLVNAAGLIGRTIKFVCFGLASHVTIVGGNGVTLCTIQGTTGTLGGVEVMVVSNSSSPAAKIVSAYTVP